MPARRWTPWRIVGAALTLLFLVAAARFWITGSRWKQDFDRWIVETPLNIPVDLSRPGVYTAPFRQECDVAHAQHLRLVVEGREEDAPDTTLDALQGSFVLTDSNGQEISRGTLMPEPEGPTIHGAPPGEVLLLRSLFGANGDYTATLTITDGVPELAGLPQRLIIRNELCGLERLPGVLSHALAVAAAVLALALGVPTTVRLVSAATAASPRPAESPSADRS